MLFAHFSDCHVGGWKEDKLRQLNMECFQKAVAMVIERRVDFLLIAGDLFNTALPQIDYIKEATIELRRLKDAGIPVYMVAGSHDYSPSGKTMLDVLEKAGLIHNVMKFATEDTLAFTVDPKTGVKITGMLGKKGGLEINDYQTLNTAPLEAEDGFKIFMFHTAINEFKPEGLEDMPGADLAALPKNFQWYAGGHVHYIFRKEYGNGVVAFPGALFPNNFKEMEEWQHGGIYFVDENVKWEYVPVKLKDVETFSIDVQDMTPEKATQTIIDTVKARETTDKIVTLRVRGELDGKTSDVSFKDVMAHLEQAYFVLRNTAKLSSKVAQEISMKAGSVEDIEQEILKEVVSEIKIRDMSKEKEEAFTQELMQVLNREKGEGEKVADFEKRVISEGLRALDIETA